MASSRFFAICAALAVGTATAAEQMAGDWSYRIAPYVWAAGIDGDSGLNGFPPQRLDLSIGDVLDNLDISFMLVGEMRRDRLSFSFDFFYVDLGNTVTTSNGIAATTIDVSSRTIMGTVMAGYNVLSDAKSSVDLVGGARFWDLDTSFDFNGDALADRSAGDGDTWVDPILGVQFRHRLTNEVYLAG